MATRSKQSQSEHDRAVREIASTLKKQQWHVEADIPGFDRPKPIGEKHRIPDVIARKHGAERLIEVETAQTMASDRDQHATFRRSVAQKPRSTFKIEEV